MRLRSTDKEIMDDLSYSGTEIAQTLRELDTINLWLGGNYVTMEAVKQIIKKEENRSAPIKIADIGCGSAKMLILVAKWARRNNINLTLTGIDANPYIVEIARKNCKDFPEITIECENICSEEFKVQKFDIVISTLFLHHFDDQQLIEILCMLKKQTSKAVIINDIHRHWVAYYSIIGLTKLFSNSEMVKNDSALSVLKAFRKEELRTLAISAGFNARKIEIAWKWAFRFQAILDCR